LDHESIQGSVDTTSRILVSEFVANNCLKALANSLPEKNTIAIDSQQPTDHLHKEHVKEWSPLYGSLFLSST